VRACDAAWCFNSYAVYCHTCEIGNTWTAEQEAAFKQPILTKYEKESHAFYSSARLWDDGIIDPADTRKVRCSAGLCDCCVTIKELQRCW
jgi:acetyl-CoA carboxylase carboxyltransferase component